MKTSIRSLAAICLATGMLAWSPAAAETSIPTTLRARPAIANVDALGIYLTMSAQLTETQSGAPIAGMKLDFYIGGRYICTGVSNSSGVGACGGPLGAVNATLNLGYGVAFYPVESYAYSADAGPIVRAAGVDVP